MVTFVNKVIDVGDAHEQVMNATIIPCDGHGIVSAMTDIASMLNLDIFGGKGTFGRKIDPHSL